MTTQNKKIEAKVQKKEFILLEQLFCVVNLAMLIS